MDKNYKQMTDYLVNMGIDKVSHTSKTYLGHLIGLHRLMGTHGCDEELCRAGMFHSIYGTQLFQGFKLPLEKRGEIRELIGERAERLAYLNCAMDRPSFDQIVCQPEGPFRFIDRIKNEEIVLARADFEDLMRIHLFDWLEQVPRGKMWDYRRAAYHNMAKHLGGMALEWYGQVFAEEKRGSANRG